MYTEIEQVFDNRYKIIKVLGKGGMSSVYLAQSNDRLKYQRAIKEVQLTKIVGSDTLHEAFILKELEHNGIPRIIEIKECYDRERIYIVQEFVKGRILEQIVKESQVIDEQRIINWAKQLADILAYVHQKKVIHRDIKLANVMVGDNNQLKLIDFGIASDEKGVLKKAYTPGFASPEQMAGQKLDNRSDIYSFGILLIKLITGQTPRLSDRRQAFDFWPNFPKSDCSQVMQVIAKKCTQPNREQRYADTKKLRNDIFQIEQGAKKRRYMRWGGYVAIAGLVITIVGGSVVVLNKRAEQKRQNEIEYQQQIKAIYEGVKQKEDLHLVLKKIESAKQLYPERVEVYEAEMLILYKGEKYQQVIDYYKSLNGRDFLAESPKINYIVGLAHMEQDDYDMAESYLQQSYQRLPEDEFCARDYSICLARNKQLEECQKVLETMRQNGHQESSRAYVKAEFERANNQPREALADYKRAQQKTLNRQVKERLYRAMISLCEEQEASIKEAQKEKIQLLEEEINVLDKGEDRQKCRQLAGAYLILGQQAEQGHYRNEILKKAILQFDKVLALDSQNPANQEVYFRQIMIYRMMEDFSKATELAKRLEADYPESIESSIQLVWIAFQKESMIPVEQRSYGQTVAAFNHLAKRHPNKLDNKECQKVCRKMQELVDKGWILDNQLIK